MSNGQNFVLAIHKLAKQIQYYAAMLDKLAPQEKSKIDPSLQPTLEALANQMIKSNRFVANAANVKHMEGLEEDYVEYANSAKAPSKEELMQVISKIENAADRFKIAGSKFQEQNPKLVDAIMQTVNIMNSYIEKLKKGAGLTEDIETLDEAQLTPTDCQKVISLCDEWRKLFKIAPEKRSIRQNARLEEIKTELHKMRFGFNYVSIDEMYKFSKDMLAKQTSETNVDEDMETDNKEMNIIEARQIYTVGQDWINIKHKTFISPEDEERMKYFKNILSETKERLGYSSINQMYQEAKTVMIKNNEAKPEFNMEESFNRILELSGVNEIVQEEKFTLDTNNLLLEFEKNSPKNVSASINEKAS